MRDVDRNPLLIDFLASLAARQLAKTTIEATRVHIGAFLVYLADLSGEPAQTVDPFHLVALRSSLIPEVSPLLPIGSEEIESYFATRLANASQRARYVRLIYVRRFLAFGRRRGLAPPHWDPTHTMHIRIPAEKRRLPIGTETVLAMMHLALGQSQSPRRDFALWMLLCMCGMRVGEVLDLTVKDFPPSGDTVYLSHPKRHPEGQMRPLPAAVARAVNQFVCSAEFIENAEGFLFMTRGARGDRVRRVRQNDVGSMVKEAAWQAGVTFDVGPHHLRHAAATIAHNAHVDLPYVIALLGHKDLSTVMRYTHPEDRIRHALLLYARKSRVPM